MGVLSAMLYFFSQHPFLSFPVCLLLGGLLVWWRENMLWLLGAFLLGTFNIVAGQMVNAAFLNAVGERGTGVIVRSEETNSRLNEQPIWRYEAIVHTRDGRDVETTLFTHTVSLWPLRNEIQVPGVNQVFELKYVPGYPRNIVILTESSAHGQARQRLAAREVVEVAERKYRFSPGNAAFAQDYRQAMQAFIDANDGDPNQQVAVTRYRQQLRALNASLPP